MTRSTRRQFLTAFAGAALAGSVAAPQRVAAGDDTLAFVARMLGRDAAISDRLRLIMPAVFPTGYTVPMEITFDGAGESSHVTRIRVYAPKNPILEVVSFNFVQGHSIVRVSTRIRLAKPQNVVAVAEMADGTLLATKTWVDVATNGCA